MHSVSIETVMVGRIRPFGPNDEPSAIRKEPVGGPIYLGLTGVDGDEQAYHSHGGPDKAILHYAAENYRIWHRFYAGFSLGRGGFGENISTVGITEETVCIGDRYRIGENVVIEVSQPRQPCWKLGHNAGKREIPRLMQEHAFTGWYYRVVEPGNIHAGALLTRTGRPHPDWPLSRIITGFYGAPLDRDFLTALTELTVLGREWRDLAQKRLDTGAVEDWDGRLYGPFLM